MMYPYRQLIKTALIFAPMMALINIFPLFLRGRLTNQDTILLLIFAVPVTFAFWGINIILIRLFENNPKNYQRYIASVFIIVFIAYIISQSVDISSFIKKPAEHQKQYSSVTISIYINTIFNNILILFILETVISRNREKLAIDEIAQLRIKNLESQQLQLRQQIQPHFLFNSLNTLKSLISNHPAEAESYLVKLSSFLRYNLSSNDHDLILLKDELKICSDYLEIQKVRFKEALKYFIAIEDERCLHYKLPIFAIQLLIENAIKHNMLTVENPLSIVIKMAPDHKISVCNNLQEKSYQEHSTQIGLKNLSERYNLLIKQDIQLVKTKEKFEVLLPLAS